jgi:LysM repeat protein
VEHNITLWQISQDQCVKLKHLAKWNKVAPDALISKGTVIYLKKKKGHRSDL